MVKIGDVLGVMCTTTGIVLMGVVFIGSPESLAKMFGNMDAFAWMYCIGLWLSALAVGMYGKG